MDKEASDLKKKMAELERTLALVTSRLDRAEYTLRYHKHLGSDETNKLASSSSGSGTPGGSDTQIQYNDAGSFGGSASFTWDDSTKTFTVGDAADTATLQTPGGTGTQAGGSLLIDAGNGGGTSGNGGDISLYAGDDSGGADAGGNIILDAGGGGIDGAVYLRHATNGSGLTGDALGGIIFAGGTAQNGNLMHFIIPNTATTQTTTATPKDIFSYLLPEDRSALFILRVVGRRTGGSSGASGDSAGYIQVGLYKRAGAGAPTLVGSLNNLFTAESQAGWDCTFGVSSNNIIVTVTGATNNTIQWLGEVIMVFQDLT
jgi:hypothetical protein